MADLQKSYIISHGFDESGRLHLQQWLWNLQLGWDLHPSIAFKSDGDIKIADHGCGNAAWLLSLDAKLKSTNVNNVSLVGLDLFPVHFPAAANLPDNIKLGVLDAFSEIVPEEHVGQYDVHVRVFTGVVKNNDPAPVVRNAFKMLKPGGYLQWDEFDGGSWKGVAPGDESSVSISATTEMLQTALESGRKAMKLEYYWIENLGKIFQEHGLELLEHKRMDVKMELRKTMTDSLLMTLHHVARIAVRDGCMVGTDKNWEQLWIKAGEEIEQGVSLTMDMLITVGRKPL